MNGSIVSLSKFSKNGQILNEKGKEISGITEWPGRLTSEILSLDATACIQQIMKGTSETLDRLSRLRSQWLHEYWRQNNKKVQHKKGTSFVPDIGTKSLSIARFSALLQLSPQRVEGGEP